MIDFNKYKKVGKRTLSSGIISDIFYDFKLLKQKENKEDLIKLVKKLKQIFQEDKNIQIVGIYSMGAYIAKLVDKNAVIYYPRLNKISEYNGLVAKGNYLLFDDVGTSFATMRKAACKIGFIPKKIVVIVNRKDVNLGIISLYGRKIIELQELLKTY